MTRYQAVAGVTGLEPATSGVTGLRSNQLSYTPGEEGQEKPETGRKSKCIYFLLCCTSRMEYS